jgi:AcrR family transcriptional regulator
MNDGRPCAFGQLGLQDPAYDRLGAAPAVLFSAARPIWALTEAFLGRIQLTVLTTSQRILRLRSGGAASADPAVLTLADRILDAARDICFAGGPEAVSARKIASAVGCTAPALYRHFKGVDHVLHALRMEGHHLLGLQLAAQAHSSLGPKRLILMQRAYFTFGVQHPRYFGLMFPSRLPIDPLLEFGQEEAESLNLVVSEAARCIEEKTIRTDLDARLVANYVWLAVHGLTATAVSGHLDATAPGMAESLLAQITEVTSAWLHGDEAQPRQEPNPGDDREPVGA